MTIENNCCKKSKFIIDKITFNQIHYFNKYEVRYGVDRIIFLSKETKNNVEACIREIRGNRGIPKKFGEVKVHDLSRQDKKYKEEGYCCKIILTRVTSKLLDILGAVSFLFTRPNLIEIFQDIVCSSKEEANKLTKYQILHAHMNRCHGGCEPQLLRSSRPETLTRGKAPKNPTKDRYEDWWWNQIPKKQGKDGVYRTKNDQTIIGDWTLYLGKEDLIYTIYARLSKQDGRPVIHSEFRIKGYDSMQKMGILDKKTTPLEAISKKVILQVSQIYKEHLLGRIRFYKINEDKVAKHFLGISKVKNPDGEQKKKMSGYLNTLKRTYSLECTAYYMQFFLDKDMHYRRFIC